MFDTTDSISNSDTIISIDNIDSIQNKGILDELVFVVLLTLFWFCIFYLNKIQNQSCENKADILLTDGTYYHKDGNYYQDYCNDEIVDDIDDDHTNCNTLNLVSEEEFDKMTMLN